MSRARPGIVPCWCADCVARRGAGRKRFWMYVGAAVLGLAGLASTLAGCWE